MHWASVNGNKARGAKQTGSGDYRVGLNKLMYGTHMRETAQGALFTRASYSPEAHGRGEGGGCLHTSREYILDLDENRFGWSHVKKID